MGLLTTGKEASVTPVTLGQEHWGLEHKTPGLPMWLLPGSVIAPEVGLWAADGAEGSSKEAMGTIYPMHNKAITSSQ